MRQLFIFFIIFIFLGCSTTPEKEHSETSNSSMSKAFSISLKDINGNQFSTRNFLEKKIVFISFWATYCEPCKSELLKLKEGYQKYKESVEFVAVSIDSQDQMSEVRQFIVENSIPFKILVDPENRVVSSIIPGGDTVPYSIIVDKSGRIVSTHTGYEPGDEENLYKKFEELLRN